VTSLGGCARPGEGQLLRALSVVSGRCVPGFWGRTRRKCSWSGRGASTAGEELCKGRGCGIGPSRQVVIVVCFLLLWWFYVAVLGRGLGGEGNRCEVS
jgi:hypothetical protein